ncbi:MAG TPA: DUF2760 domain-containing protein [Opitutaceae bacterium]|nr:DUF2760 domain-containing protein [Opitutaceae bacterium]
MKTLLIALGLGLALVHLGLMFSTTSLSPTSIHIGTALVGVAFAVVAWAYSNSPATAKPPLPPESPKLVPPPKTAPSAPTLTPRSEPVRAEAEIVAFLGLLQEKGRLIDFLREDLTGASDGQVGTAARVVHAGCRAVLDEYLEIIPVRTEAEGSKITLTVGYDIAAYRLLGSVSAQPPYQGTLLHPGWQVKTLKLPRVTGVHPSRPLPVLAPAEVEIAKS